MVLKTISQGYGVRASFFENSDANTFLIIFFYIFTKTFTFYY